MEPVLVGSIGLLAAFAALCAVPWLSSRLMTSLIKHWRTTPAQGSAFNPLLEFVQPQARHVVEVQEQALVQEGCGAPPDDQEGQPLLPAADRA
jgi:hypothetical protein